MAVYVFSMLQGMLTFISPCILPLIPVYVSYIAGSASGKFSGALAFVAGFSVVFTMLGTGAWLAGSFLSENQVLLRRISGVIMVIIGLNFLGLIRIGFLNRSRSPELKIKVTGLPGSALFGMLFAIAWTPCVTAFLGSTLLIAANSETALKGALLLLAFSAGLGIPFIASALLIGQLREAFEGIKRNYGKIKAVSGAIMIAAGFLVFFDYLKYLSF